MSRTQRALRWLFAICAVAGTVASVSVGLQACSAPSGLEGVESTGGQSGKLSRLTSDQLFGPNDTIPVCWEKNSDPGLSMQKDWVKQAVLNSWGKVTNVKFTFWQDCPPSSSTKFVTVFASNTTAVSACATGKTALNNLPEVLPDGGNGSPALSSCFLTIGGTDRAGVEAYAVHEFGHVMGYEHEQDQDAGFGDPGYSYPYQANSLCSPGGGYWDAQADAYIWQSPDGAPVGFNNDLLTAYDPDSVMNYCHRYLREFSGRLSTLDIAGVQQNSEYGAPARADMDGDGVPDYQDNCPFAANGGDQQDSNFWAELALMQQVNQNCSGWCEDGHTPTPSDLQNIPSYVTWWHKYYPGDACDATSVPATSFQGQGEVVSTVETAHLGCTDVYLGGGPPSFDAGATCPLRLNTQLTVDGHTGGPAGLALPRAGISANKAAPVFCRCELGSVIACKNSVQTRCVVAQDSAYLYGSSPTPSGYQKISVETPADNHYCFGTPCDTTYREFQVPHVDPLPTYDANSVTSIWDFIPDLATFGKTGCTNPSPCNDLAGIGWTHEHGFPYSILLRTQYETGSLPDGGAIPFEQDVQNSYWMKTAHWDAIIPHIGPMLSYKWQPVPYCNPGPKEEIEHGMPYMSVGISGGVPIFAGVNTSNVLYDETSNLTANARSLLATLGSGNELLTADDRLGGQVRTSTGYNAVVLNLGTAKVVGAIQDSGNQMDGVLASSVVGSGSASLRSFSAANQALYWLANPVGQWQLNTRLLSNAMSGNATTTVTTLSGVALQSPKATAYNRVTSSLFVLDSVTLPGGTGIRLLSVDLTSGLASSLWTTSAYNASPAPTLYLSTTLDGEAIVSASPATSGNIDILIVDSTGRPTGSYTTTGVLYGRVIGKGDGITVPLAIAADGALNIQLSYVARSAMKYGACNSTLFVGIASPSGPGALNPGFESGDTSFWSPSGASQTIVSTSHSGFYATMLGLPTPTNGDSTTSQTFIAPNGATTLSFWYKMTCPDTITYDWATATLTDNAAGGGVTTPLAKVCTTNAWTQVTTNVTAGHSYTLALTSHDDNYGADPTYTLFDDVAFGGNLPTGTLGDGASCP